jgi:hypothetical protein
MDVRILSALLQTIRFVYMFEKNCFSRDRIILIAVGDVFLPSVTTTTSLSG